MAPLPDSLLRQLEDLDLSPYEARVLLTLMRVGPSNTAQLALHSGVPRTSIYQVLEELNRSGLAQRVAVEGPAVWTSPARHEVFARINAVHEERLRQHRARTARLEEELAKTFPEVESTATAPYVQVLQGAAQTSAMWDRLLAEAQTELLVFNRPPYSIPPDEVNSAVLEAVGRGVEARALYERDQWHEPEAAAFREVMEAYHEAGVQGALVDELLIKLAVVDRKMALVTMTDSVLPDIGFPTTLLVEHPGFTSVLAGSFDYAWESAELLAPPRRKPKTATGPKRRRNQGLMASDDAS
jgi:sugar-specific transcriptional regulator TrmB